MKLSITKLTITSNETRNETIYGKKHKTRYTLITEETYIFYIFLSCDTVYHWTDRDEVSTVPVHQEKVGLWRQRCNVSTRHQSCSNTGHNRQRRHLDQCTSAHQLHAAANECFRNRKSAILCHNRSVFSFVRTLKTWSCSHLLLCALLLRRRPCSNDRYLLSTGPTAENPPHAAAAGQWDRQTDRRQRDGGRTCGRTPCRYTDAALHTIPAIPINKCRHATKLILCRMHGHFTSTTTRRPYAYASLPFTIQRTDRAVSGRSTFSDTVR